MVGRFIDLADGRLEHYPTNYYTSDHLFRYNLPSRLFYVLDGTFNMGNSILFWHISGNLSGDLALAVPVDKKKNPSDQQTIPTFQLKQPEYGLTGHYVNISDPVHI